jgi:chemotaxis protein methyltransferase CheR
LLELDFQDASAYQDYLATHPDEWKLLDSFCRITISRFYRDWKFYELMGNAVLPRLARLAAERGDAEIRCWSVGSASGEEPYTVNILWKLHPGETIPLRITATDIDGRLIERARFPNYQKSSIKGVPEEWLTHAFEHSQEGYTVRSSFRQGIEFLMQDVRVEQPQGPFHMILCRNLVFTYFDDGLQREVLSRMLDILVPGGVVAVGGRETLPESTWQLEEWTGASGIYVKKR